MTQLKTSWPRAPQTRVKVGREGLSGIVEMPVSRAQGLACMGSSRAPSELFPLEAITDPWMREAVRGNYWLIPFSPQMMVSLWDVEFLQQVHTSTQLNDYVSLEFILSGGCERHYGDQSFKKSVMPRVYLSGFSGTDQQQRFHAAGDHLQAIGMWLHRETLINEFGVDVETLPNRFRAIFEQNGSRAEVIPLSHRMRTIIEELVKSHFTGAMQRQYFRSKITELICYALDGLPQAEADYIHDNSLKAAKSKSLTKVITLLSEQYKSPPSLEALTEIAGLSRTNLCRSFKECCGVTISEYIRARRMDKAAELLAQGKYSILQVALQVGYENQSSFGRAYRKHYGRSPKTDLPKGSDSLRYC